MEVIQDISPHDSMIREPPLGGGREQYFALGDEAVRHITAAMRSIGMEQPRTILDLPCGYGRVLRTLKAAFPEAELTASDIDRGGVDFCAKTFGAEPVYSSADPHAISFEHDFDLIWCGSLFTHLDAGRCIEFLELFQSYLAPGGVLLFTTSGSETFEILRRLLPGEPEPSEPELVEVARLYFPVPDDELPNFANAYETTGFAFHDVTGDDYGISLTSRDWVEEQIDRLPGMRLVSYLEKAWGETQDVVAAQRLETPMPTAGRDPMPYVVTDVMAPHDPADYLEQTVLDVAREIAGGGPLVVPVTSANGGIEGVVEPKDIVTSLGRGEDPATTPAAAIARKILEIEPNTTLDEAQDLLPEHNGMAAVVADGVLLGVVEIAQVSLFNMSIPALGPSAGRIVTEVSPQDTWGARNCLGSIVSAGVSALKCISDAMTAAGRDGNVSSLLDFPSGYGRILRVLKAAFPDARLAAGDLDHDAVDFCARTFGAAPIYSTEKPEQIVIDDTFDLIWCGSLLTHIDPDRWSGFLSLFRETLTPDGVLVFTVSGPRLRHELILHRFALEDEQTEKVIGEYDREGFGYSDYPTVEEYGISLASPDWVREQLDAAGLRLVSYVELGWNAPAPRQDVISCVRG